MCLVAKELAGDPYCGDLEPVRFLVYPTEQGASASFILPKARVEKADLNPERRIGHTKHDVRRRCMSRWLVFERTHSRERLNTQKLPHGGGSRSGSPEIAANLSEFTTEQ